MRSPGIVGKPGAATGLEDSHGIAHLGAGSRRQAGGVTGEIDDGGGRNPAIHGGGHADRGARHGIQTVDIGVAILSMHSARELCGANDPHLLANALVAFLRG